MEMYEKDKQNQRTSERARPRENTFFHLNVKVDEEGIRISSLRCIQQTNKHTHERMDTHTSTQAPMYMRWHLNHTATQCLFSRPFHIGFPCLFLLFLLFILVRLFLRALLFFSRIFLKSRRKQPNDHKMHKHTRIYESQTNKQIDQRTHTIALHSYVLFPLCVLS